MNVEDKICKWDNYFTSRGIADNIRDTYMSYLTKLVLNDVPVIFEYEHLALHMGRSTKYLLSVINSSSYFYRDFEIKKRSGGKRRITVPYPSLLEMQYWILENILKKTKVHMCAHGYAQKKSIVTNAKHHIGQSDLLKIDLKDFFPSIRINRLIHHFKHLGYSSDVSFYLAAICSYDESLPQGSPTSPYFSNIIAMNLDTRLYSFAQKFDLKYTRYADDLVFSGSRIPKKYICYVSSIINEEGFNVNTKKTRLYKKNSSNTINSNESYHKRIVTGISVTDTGIKLPRKYKRKLRNELHFVFKYGLTSHVRKKRIKIPNYRYSLLGKVNHWLAIEPENEYAISAKKKLLGELE